MNRKIIHIDMDCFYAAIEIRDNPSLAGKPVAVGGRSGRGVLTTCNYEARKFGCHSAMPTFQALRKCPDLIVVPTRFDVYKRDSGQIREVFAEFTEMIEPLSLDEAYLDVSHLRSSAASVAKEVRYRIHQKTQLTASAGIAENKLLAKIASDWRKPNGQFEVRAEGVEEFMAALPARKLWGIGPKTAERLAAAGIETCGDLQKMSRGELAQRLGKFGVALFDLCRGRDSREVKPHRIRKSLANERTYSENLTTPEECLAKLLPLIDEQADDLKRSAPNRVIKSVKVKMKFADFTKTTVERATGRFDRELFPELLAEAWLRGEGKAVRLLGVGVRFAPPEPEVQAQMEMELV